MEDPRKLVPEQRIIDPKIKKCLASIMALKLKQESSDSDGPLDTYVKPRRIKGWKKSRRKSNDTDNFFECKLCDSDASKLTRFSSKWNLIRHLKVIHGIDSPMEDPRSLVLEQVWSL